MTRNSSKHRRAPHVAALLAALVWVAPAAAAVDAGDAAALRHEGPASVQEAAGQGSALAWATEWKTVRSISQNGCTARLEKRRYYSPTGNWSTDQYRATLGCGVI